MEEKGRVYIMGVGPGSYKLMTLKAVECLKKADVVVYDRLISDRILSFARDDAEFIYVGKMPDNHVKTQDEINRILVEKAMEGNIVARVKGGDPFLFGRGGEEAEALLKEGIEYEIVPGVTSAIAVPAYAGIPVTHRDYCSSLHIITGHERPDKSGSMIDYNELANVKGTLVFLMGVRNLNEISRNLIEKGKPADTPAAVVERGTTAAQRVVTGTLNDIAEKVAEEGIKSPAVTVIGEVANLHGILSWNRRGKISGKKVLVTRAKGQAHDLIERIEELGGEAVVLPTIKIAELSDYSEFDRILKDIESYDRIVFTSVNGVKAFFDRMKSKKIDLRRLSSAKICAIGGVTAAAIADRGIVVDYMPERYTTSSLLEGLIGKVGPNEKILLPRADIANAELSEGLKNKCWQVDDLVVYRTITESHDSKMLEMLLDEESIDCITFTSPSTVDGFVSIIGKERLSRFLNNKTACIGPVTAKAAKEHGFTQVHYPDVHTMGGLVDRIVQVLEG